MLKDAIQKFSLFFLLLFCCLLSLTTNAQNSASNSINALFHQPNDPVAGNPHGEVTLVEFFDFQCPHCIDMGSIIENVIKRNDDLRVVFKQFPIRGAMSEYAARAALAANKQGKYLEFVHGMFLARQPLTEADIFLIANASGLDMPRFKVDIDSDFISQQLAAHTALAQTLKLAGTPVFFLGKTNTRNMNQLFYFFGAISEDDLQQAINKAA